MPAPEVNVGDLVVCTSGLYRARKITPHRVYVDPDPAATGLMMGGYLSGWRDSGKYTDKMNKMIITTVERYQQAVEFSEGMDNQVLEARDVYRALQREQGDGTLAILKGEEPA